MFDIPALHGGKAPQEKPPPPPRPAVVPLSQLDLAGELASQLRDAKYLYAMVSQDESTPANQQAQVLNSISAIIKQVIDSQERLHNIQVCKEIEEALVATLREFPEVQGKFSEIYGKKLGVINT